MDLGNGSQHHAVYADALALFHNVPHHTQGDTEYKVDACFGGSACSCGDCGVLCVYIGGKGVGVRLNFESSWGEVIGFTPQIQDSIPYLPDLPHPWSGLL